MRTIVEGYCVHGVAFLVAFGVLVTACSSGGGVESVSAALTDQVQDEASDSSQIPPDEALPCVPGESHPIDEGDSFRDTIVMRGGSVSHWLELTSVPSMITAPESSGADYQVDLSSATMLDRAPSESTFESVLIWQSEFDAVQAAGDRAIAVGVASFGDDPETEVHVLQTVFVRSTSGTYNLVDVCESTIRERIRSALAQVGEATDDATVSQTLSYLIGLPIETVPLPDTVREGRFLDVLEPVPPTQANG